MVCILFVGGIKTQQALENNYFIAYYNLFHQEVGSMPPNCPSTIFEDLVVHTSKSEVSGKFPHERIIALDPLKWQHVHIAPPPPARSPPSSPPAFLNVWKSWSGIWKAVRIYCINCVPKYLCSVCFNTKKMIWLDLAGSASFSERSS